MIHQRTDDGEPTFGQYLRATRLGYHWIPDIAAFVRVSGGTDVSGAPMHWTVQVTPFVTIDRSSKGSTLHRCFWESDFLLGCIIRALVPLGPFPKARTVRLDDDAQVIS